MDARWSGNTGWALCRNYQTIPLATLDVLPSWAERGRLRPDDYLTNGALEVCIQAKDVPELNAIFRRATASPWRAIIRTLGLAEVVFA